LALAELARQRHLPLRPALALNHCAYLHNFAEAARGALAALSEVIVIWRDPPAEPRYGETKSIDTGTGLGEDVGPHVATLVAAVARPAKLTSAVIARGGLSVRLDGTCAAATLTIEMAREASGRDRSILLRDVDGREARLDFSTEPGIITVGGVSRDADPGWGGRLSPLTLQLLDFLRADSPREEDLAAILDTTAFSSAAATLVRQAQHALLKKGVASAEDRLVAAKELLAPKLIAAGLAPPGDNAALETAARRALADDPEWTTYL